VVRNSCLGLWVVAAGRDASASLSMTGALRWRSTQVPSAGSGQALRRESSAFRGGVHFLRMTIKRIFVLRAFRGRGRPRHT